MVATENRLAPSLRLHFTFDDLLRVSISEDVRPHVETFFALRSLSGPSTAALADWAARVRPELAPFRRLLTMLGQWIPSPSVLLRLLRGALQETRAVQLRTGATGEQLRDALSHFWQVALEPFWKRIVAHVRGWQAKLRSQLAGGGVEDLLSHLPGGGTWQQPVLSLPDELSADLRLSGQGLHITSSVFQHRNCRILEGAHGQGRPTLYLQAPLEGGEASAIWEEAGGEERSLAALMGAARARVLQALTERRTTGELAQLAGISGPGASQHTAVLRKAGLITTRRERNLAWHELTPLGRAMLDNLEEFGGMDTAVFVPTVPAQVGRPQYQ
ncbi:ArsR/SmtB family transcription factor [Streptomyces celluloflavus]|uniref:ArsR/SmtB family transcription factor n=1 Tax=Streptomyces celluloflavus TaxID=58344 RepID=UPI00368366D7